MGMFSQSIKWTLIASERYQSGLTSQLTQEIRDLHSLEVPDASSSEDKYLHTNSSGKKSGWEIRRKNRQTSIQNELEWDSPANDDYESAKFVKSSSRDPATLAMLSTAIH